MKQLSWMTFVVLPLFILALGVTPHSSWAQSEEEEEEVLQPKDNSRPNPMERTMRKAAGRSNTMILNDGRRLQQSRQGNKNVWFVIGKNGQRSVANGSYALQNGQRMNIQRGMLNKGQMRNQRQMQKMR